MSERDTHFAGFAELLWDELQETDGLFTMMFSREDCTEFRAIIARRAYDLLFHCFKQYPLTDEEAHRHIIRNCPDLMELPSSQEEK